MTRLTELSEAAGPELTQILPRLDAGQRQQLVLLTAAVQDLLSLGQLGLLGFDAALAGHDGFGKMQLAPATRSWAAERSRHDCAGILAGMMACSLAAVVEAYVGELGGAKPELELHRRSDGGEWVQQVEHVFDLQLDQAVRETLVTLVDARREFATDPLRQEADAPIAELYAAWPQACVLLAAAVARRVARPGAIA